MSEIEFENDNAGLNPRTAFEVRATPRIIVFIMKTFGIKSEKSAKDTLITLSAFFIITAIFVSIYAINKNTHPVIKNYLSPETIKNLPPSMRNALGK